MWKTYIVHDYLDIFLVGALFRVFLAAHVDVDICHNQESQNVLLGGTTGDYGSLAMTRTCIENITIVAL